MKPVWEHLLFNYLWLIDFIQTYWHGGFYYRARNWLLWLKTDIDDSHAYLNHSLFWDYDDKFWLEDSMESIRHLRNIK